MLAAPSTPEPVRQEIERRAVEGGDTSVAEIARLKAEHKAEAERLKAAVALQTDEVAKLKRLSDVIRQRAQEGVASCQGRSGFRRTQVPRSELGPVVMARTSWSPGIPVQPPG